MVGTLPEQFRCVFGWYSIETVHTQLNSMRSSRSKESLVPRAGLLNKLMSGILGFSEKDGAVLGS